MSDAYLAATTEIALSLWKLPPTAPNLSRNEMVGFLYANERRIVMEDRCDGTSVLVGDDGFVYAVTDCLIGVA